MGRRIVVNGWGWGIRLGWRDLRAVREPPLHPHKRQGCEVPAYAGTTGPRTLILTFSQREKGPTPPSRERRGGRRVNDAYDQCKGWRGDGAMGSCRWVGGYVWDGVTFGRFANRPYIHTRGRDARFPPTRERRGPEPSSSPSPSGRRDLPRLRGNDGCFRVNDACDQCRGWRGDGAMGSCRWLGVRLGWRDVKAVREPPLHPHRRC